MALLTKIGGVEKVGMVPENDLKPSEFGSTYE
jgi:hypothetical protein